MTSPKRPLYDPRAYHGQQSPFAAQMTCLVCGARWWSQTEEPSACPKCKVGNRIVSEP